MSDQRFRSLDDTANYGSEETVCFLEHFVDGINMESWRILEGAPLGKAFPKDARIYMSPQFRGMRLADLIGNTKGMLLVSTPFKEAIEKRCKGVEIEYLPVTIHDHRKRAHGKGYYIVNPIGALDCLDLDKSDIEWDDEEPGEVMHLEEPVLDRKKMKGAPQLFRVDKDPSVYVIGRELAREIYDQKLTNVFWTELRFGDEG
jgi:hypothetical protein